MQRRNLAFVFFISIITFGIYAIVWFWKTTNELVRLGAKIQHPGFMFVPLYNFYWLYAYFKGAESVTKTLNGVIWFIVFMVGSIITSILSYGSFDINADTREYSINGSRYALSVLVSLITFGILPYIQSKYNKISAGDYANMPPASFNQPHMQQYPQQYPAQQPPPVQPQHPQQPPQHPQYPNQQPPPVHPQPPHQTNFPQQPNQQPPPPQR